MDMSKISAGKDLPHDFNVVIEIPAQSDPVKYEVDKESGALLVDRFIGTSMRYPANYGFIPQTLGDDGDPVDVCVITPFPLLAGSVIRCRPLGMLLMEDESGGDMKMLAVPVQKLTPRYNRSRPSMMFLKIILLRSATSLNTTKIWKKASGLRYPAGQVLKKPAR